MQSLLRLPAIEKKTFQVGQMNHFNMFWSVLWPSLANLLKNLGLRTEQLPFPRKKHPLVPFACQVLGVLEGYSAEDEGSAVRRPKFRITIQIKGRISMPPLIVWLDHMIHMMVQYVLGLPTRG